MAAKELVLVPQPAAAEADKLAKAVPVELDIQELMAPKETEEGIKLNKNTN